MKQLTDTHCHLSLDQFSGEVGEILERAHSAGVDRMVVPGIDLETSRQAVVIAEQLGGVYASVGVHPHNAVSYSEVVRDRLLELADSSAVVAIGEIGLDYYRNLSPRAQQVAALKDQLDLARELSMPVIIHNREAHKELFEVLIEWAPTVSGTKKGVLHAFSGTRKHAEIALSSGFFLGVAGPITYPSAEELRQTMKRIPLDGLLLETDSPYLPPQAHRGQRNEPAYLTFIAEELRRLKDIQIDKLSTNTSRNAGELFGWVNGSANANLS